MENNVNYKLRGDNVECLDTKRKDINNIKEEYAALYEHLKFNEGLSEGKAIEVLKEHITTERLNSNIGGNHNVRLHIELDKLEEYTDWVNLNTNDRNKLLYTLGFDINNCQWGVERKMIRVGTECKYVTVVFGSERLDEEWINNTTIDDKGTEYLTSSEDCRDYVWRSKVGS